MGNLSEACLPTDQGFVEKEFVLYGVKVPAHVLIKIFSYLPIQYIYGSKNGIAYLNQTFYNFLYFHHCPLWDHFHSTYHYSNIPNEYHLEEMGRVIKRKGYILNENQNESGFDRFMTFENHILTRMMTNFAKNHLYPPIFEFIKQQKQFKNEMHLPVPPSLCPIFPFEQHQPTEFLLNYALMNALKHLSLLSLKPNEVVHLSPQEHLAVFIVNGHCSNDQSTSVIKAPACIKIEKVASYVALNDVILYTFSMMTWKKAIVRCSQ